MRSPIGWAAPVLAGVFSLVAVAAGDALWLALPAAAIAIGLGGSALASVVSSDDGPETPGVESPAPLALGGAREMFHSGSLGREDLVLALDRLERRRSRPDLPSRTATEMARFVRAPEAEFRRYLAGRVEALERSA